MSLFDAADIPWQDIAFPSTVFTLRRYLAGNIVMPSLLRAYPFVWRGTIAGIDRPNFQPPDKLVIRLKPIMDELPPIIDERMKTIATNHSSSG